MILDLQKANMWKRISAYLFDTILLGIAAVGLAFLLSNILGYDYYSNKLNEAYQKYALEYGVDFEISAADYELLSDEELRLYDDAIKAMNKDNEVTYVYTMVINLTVLMVTFGILFAYLLFEFTVPLMLKNGQTLGKKIFGIGIMRTDGIKITPMFLFIRTVLGKYAIETMVPVMIILMIYLRLIGILGIGVIAILGVIQVVLLIATRTNSPIHDKLASTVAVDISSQMIFDTQEELLEYKKKLHTQQVTNTDYA